MTLCETILEHSAQVDERFRQATTAELLAEQLVFTVPAGHPRSTIISSYPYEARALEELPGTPAFVLSEQRIFIVDAVVSQLGFVKAFLQQQDARTIVLQPSEFEVKTKAFVDRLMKDEVLAKEKDATIIVMGGGLLLNVGAYIAEQIHAHLIQMPTTLLSMADGSGGKVRLNLLEGKVNKHHVKSFYEPDAIFLDTRFIDSLPPRQILYGLVEIIKHGLFQSPALCMFLQTRGEDLLNDKDGLLKAALWAAHLKHVCLECDPDETPEGSLPILRGGHAISDRIEEDQQLRIPHGIAVAIGIVRQLEEEKQIEPAAKAKGLFDMFGIPYTIDAFNAWVSKR